MKKKSLILSCFFCILFFLFAVASLIVADVGSAGTTLTLAVGTAFSALGLMFSGERDLKKLNQ